jgi:uncharacterized protein YggT (Ycf19 family)
VFLILNFVLAAAMYTLLGRFLLSLVIDERSEIVIWKVFRQITDPMLAVARFLTPAIVSPRILILLAALWCLMLRMASFLAMNLFYAPVAATGG